MTQVEIPKIFNILQEWGGIETKEMYGTFNMGLGMVLVVSEETAQEILSKEDQKLYRLGKVTKGDLCVEI